MSASQSPADLPDDASWPQLRHDTILYAEQSCTPILLCEYPDGYVEPLPALWQRIREMASATREVVASLSTNGASHSTT